MVGLTEPYTVVEYFSILASHTSHPRSELRNIANRTGNIESVPPAVRRFDISLVGPSSYLIVLLGQTNQALGVMSGGGVGLT